jgi:hypothetical protein
MPYIPSRWEDWPANIILPPVAEYICREHTERASQQKGFPLHDYLHHGLSSQAMLFNLVGPLILANDLRPIQAAFEGQEIAWPQGRVLASFEYDDRTVFNEDAGHPTSVDLILKDEAGYPKLFVESKLVEKEFGGCTLFRDGDCEGRNPTGDLGRCYLHHIGRRYWQVLEKHGFMTGKAARESFCILAIHYQFFREFLFALERGGSFVLLSDDRSPTFFCHGPMGKRGLMPLLLSFVPEPLRDRIGMVSIQQVVAAIKESERHGWIAQFEMKYGMTAQKP